MDETKSQFFSIGSNELPLAWDKIMARTRNERRRSIKMENPLNGWNITRFVDTEWIPWGAIGDARAKVLGSADGYTVALVESQAGYRGTPHEHAHAEFFYLIDGHIRNQGQELKTGDGYAAAAGSMHTDFEALARSTYLSIFKL